MNPSEEKTELRTVDDFIAFFSAIPEDRWMIGDFGVEDYGTDHRHDAMGHLGALYGHSFPPVCERLKDMFLGHFKTFGPIAVNDGHHKQPFRQKHPKARILAALNAIKQSNS